MKSPTQEEKQAMVVLYTEGLSAREAATEYGWSEQVCLRALQAAGIPRRSRMECSTLAQQRSSYIPPHTMPESARDAIVQAYKEGASVRSIAKSFGYSRRTCHKALRAAALSIRNSPSRYMVNNTFFDSIDTEEKAYWLGFIAADGCIHKGILIISLASKDHDHLAKFKDALPSNHPIVRKLPNHGSFSTGESCDLRIGSRLLVEGLMRQGITEAKSHTIKPWDGPPCLMRHYWRGVLDGDGWITFNANSGKWTIGVVGSRPMMEGYASYVRGLANVRAGIHASGNVWRVQVGGKWIPQQIVRHFYDGAQVYLDRKKALADTLLAENFKLWFHSK